MLTIIFKSSLAASENYGNYQQSLSTVIGIALGEEFLADTLQEPVGTYQY